jgi:hypothetical protein
MKGRAISVNRKLCRSRRRAKRGPMQLDCTVRSKSACDRIGKIWNRLENVNPAEVSREYIACPLPFVAAHVEHE